MSRRPMGIGGLPAFLGSVKTALDLNNPQILAAGDVAATAANGIHYVAVGTPFGNVVLGFNLSMFANSGPLPHPRSGGWSGLPDMGMGRHPFFGGVFDQMFGGMAGVETTDVVYLFEAPAIVLNFLGLSSVKQGYGVHQTIDFGQALSFIGCIEVPSFAAPPSVPPLNIGHRLAKMVQDGLLVPPQTK